MVAQTLKRIIATAQTFSFDSYDLAIGLCLTRPQCSGHTALHKAAERGHASLARFLIASNAMEEVRDACGSAVVRCYCR